MIILTTTSDKIQVSLSNNIATSQFVCYASYRDTTSTSITPLRNVISTNNTTQVNLIDSPASSTQRIIDYFSIYNSDTAVNEVTVRFFDGSNSYRLIVIRLAIGERLEYQEGSGMRVISNGSAVKTITTFDSIADTTNFGMFVLGNDYISAGSVNNTALDIPNLQVPVKAGKIYWFRYIFFYDANATTTGNRWNINGGSGDLYYYALGSLTSTTISVFTAGSSTFNSIVTSNATSAATSGNVTIIEGFFTPYRDSVIFPNFASELASPNDITAKAYSFVTYKQVA